MGDIPHSEEMLDSDFGVLKARWRLDGDREDVEICFRGNPAEPKSYTSIMEAVFEILPLGDKVLRRAEFAGGGFIDNLSGNADFSGTGKLITRTIVDDDLLCQLLDALPDKKKFVKNLKENIKYGDLKGLSKGELDRIDRLAKIKPLW